MATPAPSSHVDDGDGESSPSGCCPVNEGGVGTSARAASRRTHSRRAAATAGHGPGHTSVTATSSSDHFSRSGTPAPPPSLPPTVRAVLSSDAAHVHSRTGNRNVRSATPRTAAKTPPLRGIRGIRSQPDNVSPVSANEAFGKGTHRRFSAPVVPVKGDTQKDGHSSHALSTPVAAPATHTPGGSEGVLRRIVEGMESVPPSIDSPGENEAEDLPLLGKGSEGVGLSQPAFLSLSAEESESREKLDVRSGVSSEVGPFAVNVWSASLALEPHSLAEGSPLRSNRSSPKPPATSPAEHVEGHSRGSVTGCRFPPGCTPLADAITQQQVSGSLSSAAALCSPQETPPPQRQQQPELSRGTAGFPDSSTLIPLHASASAVTSGFDAGGSSGVWDTDGDGAAASSLGTALPFHSLPVSAQNSSAHVPPAVPPLFFPSRAQLSTGSLDDTSSLNRGTNRSHRSSVDSNGFTPKPDPSLAPGRAAAGPQPWSPAREGERPPSAGTAAHRSRTSAPPSAARGPDESSGAALRRMAHGAKARAFMHSARSGGTTPGPSARDRPEHHPFPGARRLDAAEDPLPLRTKLALAAGIATVAFTTFVVMRGLFGSDTPHASAELAVASEDLQTSASPILGVSATHAPSSPLPATKSTLSMMPSSVELQLPTGKVALDRFAATQLEVIRGHIIERMCSLHAGREGK